MFSSSLLRCSRSTTRRAALLSRNNGLRSFALTSLSSTYTPFVSSDTSCQQQDQQPKQKRFMSSSKSKKEGGGMYDKLAFIGTGKMAQAMIQPLISKGLQPEDKIAVYDVSTTAMKTIKNQFPQLQTSNTIKELVADADGIVCAVKPQNINADFWAQFPEKMREDATFISILAGTPVRDFDPSGVSKIVRAMPNTPATIGEGMTVWCCTPNLSSRERALVKQVLCTFGKTIYVDDEKFVDMSTSISGSGPAYIFMLMEAMIDAGVHMGFSRKTATTLTHHTLLGSTLYAMETNEHPAILRNSVTSPAGTTASALYELENGKFRVVIKDAIWACYRRSLEMGGNASDVGPGRTQQEMIQEVVHHHHNEYRDVPSGEMRGDRDTDDDTDSDSDSDTDNDSRKKS